MTGLFKYYLLFLVMVLPELLHAQTVQPVGAQEEWVLQESLSDEFNDAELNSAKWNNTPGSWAVWSWDGDNAYLEDSSLHLRMNFAPHTRNNMDLFYKSGIALSNGRITYGYFEARIKGCHTFPGASPAFWLYTTKNFGHEKIHSCEIDVVEMQQANWSGGVHKGVEHIDMNLHTRVYNEEGEAVWIRPAQDPELCKHEWEAPWDPREEYHVYAVESRPDTIIWYIDGIERARAENRYWHLPMNVCLSLGLRYPHVKYIDGDRYPVPEAATPTGFPTEMEVDYVRIWMKDMVRFRSRPDSIPSGTLLPFSLDYSASASREIHLQLSDSTGTMLGDTFAVVQQGMGSVELFINTNPVSVEEEAVVISTLMRPQGGPQEAPQEEILDTDTLRTYVSAGIDVNFLILDVLKQVPIEGVEVEFNGILEASDQEGMVYFSKIPLGEYSLNLRAPYHKDIVKLKVRISNDDLLTLNMQPETYTVQFQVRELKNNNPVQLATIHTWRGDDLSDGLGEMEMETSYGELLYSISMNNFETYKGTALISKDTTILVPLKRLAAHVTVKLYHKLSVIQGAEVFLGLEQQQTDAAGIAEFQAVPSDSSITFMIVKDGFDSRDDQLVVNSDTLVTVRLLASTGMKEQWQASVKVYPNPATNRLFVEGIPEGSILILVDCTGRQLMNVVVRGETLELDLSKLPPGLYSIYCDEHYLSGFVKSN